MKYCPECKGEMISSFIDNKNRMVCTKECGFVYWNNPVPVATALVELGGKYIIARNREWPDGFFSLISGFIEAGETPESAIKRETKEELGLNANKVEFIGHYSFPQMNQLMIAFVVKAEGEINLSEELLEHKVLSPEQLASYDFGVLKLGKLVVDKWLANKV